MHLVEAEAVGPIEGDEPAVTAPRPPHRRVSVSLIFTLSVLIGLVVTIYTVLPMRHDEIVTVAVRQHRATETTWDLDGPSAAELRAWTIGVIGDKDVPLPAEPARIIGARRIEVIKRPAAVIRLQVGSEPVTYVVQNARGIAPGRVTRAEGELRALGWRDKSYVIVVVGADATARDWAAALGAK
jgi:hypothetical protein